MSESPYLTVAEASAYMRFSSLSAFYAFRSRRKAAGFPVKAYRRGGKLFFTHADLDAAFDAEQAPRLPRVRRSA